MDSRVIPSQVRPRKHFPVPGPAPNTNAPDALRRRSGRLRSFRAAVAALALALAVAIPRVALAETQRNLLLVSEMVAANQSGLRDEDGETSDWIELHNPGDTPVPLAGWSLSDESGNPRKWTFRTGSIPPRGYQIVFASGKNSQPEPVLPRAPDSIPGLAAWLRADSIRPSDTSHVRVSGDIPFVRLWPDSGARRLHARQDQASAQPRFVPGTIPSLRFDGSDDLLRLATAPGTNHFTLFAVFKPIRAHEIDPVSSSGFGGTSGQAWLLGAAHGGDAGAGLGLSVGTNGVAVYEHGSSYMPAVAAWNRPLAPSWNVASVLESDRATRLSVNGLASRPGPPSPRDPVSAPAEIGSGAYGAFAGDIAELAFYSRALSEAERRSVDAHLLSKYSVLAVPTFHTNFRIDASGERLVLTAPDGTRTADLRTPVVPRNVSWGMTGAAREWRFFETPTPGSPNPDRGATAFLRPPRLSFPPGFHASPITVELMSADPGVEIRFTLDGSDPTSNSPKYNSPVAVTNRASIPNRLSAIPTSPGWNPPSGRVFKGTVVRAKAFRPDALPSETATATYFIHPSGRARYSLPVFSLATDDRHFFSPETGIYVPGNAPGGNYAQSGDAWERPVHVEFFETDGSRPVAQESGVRMHGNTSFGFPIKALRLHPLNQLGKGPFRHRIFPDHAADSFDRLLLRPSGHDHHLTMMRDGLMLGLARELAVETQRYRPAIVFVNGEYWGLHNLQEAFEKGFFAAHHPDVDPNAIDYLEGYAPGAFAYEGDATRYHALVRFLESNPISRPDAFDWVGSQIDLASFRDYKLAEIYYYRWDIGNHRLWRPRTDTGRLRWILFDCDVGFGGFWSEPNPWNFDMLRAVLEPTGTLHGHNNPSTVFLLDRLLPSPSFRSGFINRAADLLNTTFLPESVIRRIDQMATEIAPEMVEHCQRWRVPANFAEWQRHVEALRNFARERPTHLRRHFQDRFALSGTTTLVVRGPTAGAGSVRVNSLRPIPSRETTWSGTYFRAHPIEIEALPSPGFAFAGWNEFPGLTNNPLVLSLTADFTLTPRFSRAAELRLHLASTPTPALLELVVSGSPSESVWIESSNDLRNWQPYATLTLNSAAADASQRHLQPPTPASPRPTPTVTARIPIRPDSTSRAFRARIAP